MGDQVTDRVVPFEHRSAAERIARAARLNAAFTVLVDPQRDPDSISLAARLCGGVVHSSADLIDDATYDPLAFGRPGGGRGLLVQSQACAEALAASASNPTSSTTDPNQD